MTFNRRMFVLSQCLLPTVLLIGTGCSTTPPAAQSYEETPVGTVMLAAMPILVGLQFVLAFVASDIASVPRRVRHRRSANRQRGRES